MPTRVPLIKIAHQAHILLEGRVQDKSNRISTIRVTKKVNVNTTAKFTRQYCYGPRKRLPGVNIMQGLQRFNWQQR